MSEAPPFSIGETVYVAEATAYKQVQIPCPICFGKLYVTLILGNGEEQPVACDYCRSGFDGPSGVASRHAPHSEVITGTVTGISQRWGGWTIEVNGLSRTLDHIFRDAESAEACRQTLHVAAEAQAQANFESLCMSGKKKKTWNAGYSREQIKGLERQLAWHRAKLTKRQKETL